MKKQFATYEIALAMKELGFDEPCLGYFPNVENSDKTMIFFDRVPEYTINSLFDKNPTNYHFTAPLWQQCVDWFREQFNLMINSPVSDEWNTGKWSVKLESLDKKMILEEHVGQPYWRIYRGFDSYEKAKEQAILKCIELCKKQKEI